MLRRHVSYNVAPRSNAPVVRQDREGDHAYFLQTMTWGLIPHWTKHEPDSSTAMNTINARSENLLERGGMWGSLKGKKRCLVVCDGYYEWLKKGNHRTPYFTHHPDGKCMLLAGLWDSVTYEGATEPLFTYTIITTDSSKEMSFLHDRMPVILSTEEEIKMWLDPTITEWSNEKLGKLLRPYEGHLESYPVAAEVGNVRKDSPTFIQPISRRADGIQAMFQKQEKKQEFKSSQPEARSSQSTVKGESPRENKQFEGSQEATTKVEQDEKGEGGAFVTEDNQPSNTISPATPSRKRTKTEDTEDDSDIVAISPPAKKSKVEPRTPAGRPKPTPAKGKLKGADEKTPKITKFFGADKQDKKPSKITSFFNKA
ncbi:DUF159-domain-containing protein [Calocera cornea HHB12733]|uniref:DUF159-domain-containing protein n=1 Tax=Calocera cornea HHB12733 TaxID=1353952 RepID=A0A165HPV0_9BASI|nr:DUF159-domain-containing protein [Calocera cornea HHB12733]